MNFYSWIIILCITLLSSCQAQNDNFKTKTNTFLPTLNNTNKQKIANNNHQYKNLWNEISANHSLTNYKNKDLFWHIDWFKKNPKYLTRITKRADLYLKIVLDEVKKQGLPYELALLPIIESAYYPFAYSHGTASGMWQFIPSTAKLYGLKQDFWIDERRDVIRSTKAAISYLKSLNKFFRGNWLHAIAAYNSGPGRVKRAIERNKRLGKPTDFWHLKLPKETRGYVPRLLAVAEIIQHPHKYNQTIYPVNNKTKIGEVLLESQLDLATVVKWSGLNIDRIYELNAGLNRWATPNARYHLKLPINKVTSFRKKLQKYPKNQRIKWIRHKIKSGDSILSLAKKYATSSKTIKEINNIKNNKIIIGKYLIIPISSQDKSYYSMSQLRLKAGRSKENYTKTIHIVKKGDSLWSIARRYSVKINNIIKWNHLPSKIIINPGYELIIFQKKQLSIKDLNSKMQVKNTIQRTVFYKIRSGDNLSLIASKFKVSVNDIVKWNKLNIHKPLKIGKKIKLFINIINS